MLRCSLFLILLIGVMIVHEGMARKCYHGTNYYIDSEYPNVKGTASPICRPPTQLQASFSRGRRNAEDSCSFEMSKVGVNTTTFYMNVAHGIHSITVEDLKYYFDPSVPNDNNIPTVNANLTGQHVLPSAPFGSEFQTPGMRLVDFILSNDDDTNNFLIRDTTRLEKIAHGMHMLELWHKTSGVYEKIKSDPSSNQICSCITNEATNDEIVYRLTQISNYLRSYDEEELNNNHVDTDSTSEMDGDAGSSSENTDDVEGMPGLKDAESWATWKWMLNTAMLDDNGIYHLAMYLYCKIATYAEN